MNDELEGFENDNIFDEPTIEMELDTLVNSNEPSWKVAGYALGMAAILSIFQKKKDV